MSARPLRPAEDTPLARFGAIVAEARAIGNDLDPEQAIAALGLLEPARAALWGRVVRPAAVRPEPGDRLLSARAAGMLLAVPVKAMYRESWPFAVKVSEGRVRFSERGIQQYIRTRQGRA